MKLLINHLVSLLLSTASTRKKGEKIASRKTINQLININ